MKIFSSYFSIELDEFENFLDVFSSRKIDFENRITDIDSHRSERFDFRLYFIQR